MSAAVVKLRLLANLDVKNVHHNERPAIEQDHVAADDYMLALRRRRRQASHEIVGTAHNLFSQARGQRSSHHQLALEARWEPIALGQPRRKMPVVLVVPAAHLIPVVIGVGVAAVVLVVAVTVLVIIVTVVLLVAVSVPLGYGQGGGKRHSQNCTRGDAKPCLP